MKLVEITEFLVGNAAFITSLFNEDLMRPSGKVVMEGPFMSGEPNSL